MGLSGVEHGGYGTMINCLGAFAGTLGSLPWSVLDPRSTCVADEGHSCFCCPNPYKSVSQGSVGLVTRFGQFYKAVDPGLVKINPYSEKIRIVDVKIQIAGIPRQVRLDRRTARLLTQAQTVMTRDNVNIQIDSVLFFHIEHPYKAAFGISDVRLALIERAQTTLRHVIGARNLQSVLTDREAVAAEIEGIVEDVAARWGVSIESILIKVCPFLASAPADVC